MNICFKPDCDTSTKRKTSRFCSLQCANEYNGSLKTRTLHTKICDNLVCGNSFETSDRSKRFCNRSCAASHNNKKYQKRPPSTLWRDCVGCTERVFSKKYCSTACRQSHEITLWLSGELDGTTKYGVATFVRLYLNKRSGGQCEGIDSRTGDRCLETRVVQVDHIDGNWTNSTETNVRHLCPTCHTLTPTYAGRNSGRGRTWKQNYNQYKRKDDLDK